MSALTVHTVARMRRQANGRPSVRLICPSVVMERSIMADVGERREARAARWAAGVQTFRHSVTLYQQVMRRVAEQRATRLAIGAIAPPPTDTTPLAKAPVGIASAVDVPMTGTLATPPTAIDEQRTAQLTRRQREVATLIARGLTNWQIADELVLAKGTVANHVEHILGRLDLSSRTQIAVWAVERGLGATGANEADTAGAIAPGVEAGQAPGPVR